jgi:hypothetical protein
MRCMRAACAAASAECPSFASYPALSYIEQLTVASPPAAAADAGEEEVRVRAVSMSFVDF